MTIFSLSITDILSNLLKLGVNLSDQQSELLKWRLSDAGNKYYSDKENNDFYEALLKGNTEIIDAIRKEKQKRIDDMKNNLITIVGILLIPFCLTSCRLFNPTSQIDMKVIEQKWDSNSLTEKDKTYKFSDQSIKITNDSKPTMFHGDWFVVNQDFIKTFNENQDTLIKSLEKIKSITNQQDKKNTYFKYAGISVVIAVALFACINLLRRKSYER